MDIGFGEILIILVVVLLLFGPSKLPQLGESLGRGIRNFKKAVSHEEPEAKGPERPPPELPPAAPGTPAGSGKREPVETRR